MTCHRCMSKGTKPELFTSYLGVLSHPTPEEQGKNLRAVSVSAQNAHLPLISLELETMSSFSIFNTMDKILILSLGADWSAGTMSIIPRVFIIFISGRFISRLSENAIPVLKVFSENVIGSY